MFETASWNFKAVSCPVIIMIHGMSFYVSCLWEACNFLSGPPVIFTHLFTRTLFNFRTDIICNTF